LNESLEHWSSSEYESSSSESELEFKTNDNQIKKTKESSASGINFIAKYTQIKLILNLYYNFVHLF
jgi:hypothetical protein